MKRADIIIIGGGLSGLYAAREAQRRNRSVIVLEARNRVGGRTESALLGKKFTVDVGGQWVGPTQDRLYHLADELGVATFPQYTAGKQILERNGKISSYEGTIPSLPIFDLLELHTKITWIEKKSRKISKLRPWEFKRAKEWDNITVEAWKQRHVKTSGARMTLDSAVRAIFACEPSEISFLYFMQYANTAGGFMRLADVKGGAQQDRFIGGVGQLSGFLMKQLNKEKNDSVILSTPVTRIEQNSKGIAVYTDNKKHPRFEAKKAIIALSPSLSGKIDIPSLPSGRIALQDRMPMGSVIKCFALYESPFWRDKGLSGECVSDGPGARIVFDASPPDGKQGALMGFVHGEEARRLTDQTSSARQNAVLASFSRYFGARALKPIVYLEKNWLVEKYSLGCYAGLMPPGVLTEFGMYLQQSHGHIHFAGTESANEWTGYIEGALEAGERAAKEVADALS